MALFRFCIGFLKSANSVENINLAESLQNKNNLSADEICLCHLGQVVVWIDVIKILIKVFEPTNKITKIRSQNVGYNFNSKSNVPSREYNRQTVCKYDTKQLKYRMLNRDNGHTFILFLFIHGDALSITCRVTNLC